MDVILTSVFILFKPGWYMQRLEFLSKPNMFPTLYFISIKSIQMKYFVTEYEKGTRGRLYCIYTRLLKFYLLLHTGLTQWLELKNVNKNGI